MSEDSQRSPTPFSISKGTSTLNSWGSETRFRPEAAMPFVPSSTSSNGSLPHRQQPTATHLTANMLPSNPVLQSMIVQSPGSQLTGPRMLPPMSLGPQSTSSLGSASISTSTSHQSSMPLQLGLPPPGVQSSLSSAKPTFAPIGTLPTMGAQATATASDQHTMHPTSYKPIKGDENAPRGLGLRIEQSTFSYIPKLASNSSVASANENVSGPQTSMRSESLPRGLIPSEPPEPLAADNFESPETVISDLKLQIESLITAIMMSSGGSKSSTSQALQGSDAVEVAHRMMTRLKLLREENEHLAELANGVHAARLEAQNAELLRENADLRKRLAEAQKRRRI